MSSSSGTSVTPPAPSEDEVFQRRFRDDQEEAARRNRAVVDYAKGGRDWRLLGSSEAGVEKGDPNDPNVGAVQGVLYQSKLSKGTYEVYKNIDDPVMIAGKKLSFDVDDKGVIHARMLVPATDKKDFFKEWMRGYVQGTPGGVDLTLDFPKVRDPANINLENIVAAYKAALEVAKETGAPVKLKLSGPCNEKLDPKYRVDLSSADRKLADEIYGLQKQLEEINTANHKPNVGLAESARNFVDSNVKQELQKLDGAKAALGDAVVMRGQAVTARDAAVAVKDAEAARAAALKVLPQDATTAAAITAAEATISVKAAEVVTHDAAIAKETTTILAEMKNISDIIGALERNLKKMESEIGKFDKFDTAQLLAAATSIQEKYLAQVKDILGESKTPTVNNLDSLRDLLTKCEKQLTGKPTELAQVKGMRDGLVKLEALAADIKIAAGKPLDNHKALNEALEKVGGKLGIQALPGAAPPGAPTDGAIETLISAANAHAVSPTDAAASRAEQAAQAEVTKLVTDMSKVVDQLTKAVAKIDTSEIGWQRIVAPYQKTINDMTGKLDTALAKVDATVTNATGAPDPEKAKKLKEDSGLAGLKAKLDTAVAAAKAKLNPPAQAPIVAGPGKK